MSRQLALDVLSDDAREQFRRIIAAVRPGSRVTANTLRDLMDAAGIPAAARGPLLGAACRRGVLEAASVVIDGEVYGLTRASTGESAKGAGVKVYRRRAA